MKKHLALFIVFLCLFLSPAMALSAIDGDLSISEAQVRFSTNKFIEGQTIRIYATIANNSSKDLLGTVKFTDMTQEKQIDGDQPVSAFAGKTDDVFVDYKLPAGTIKIQVQVIPFQKEIDNPANNTAAKTIYSEADLDRDGIPDSIDPDWDNDGAPNAQDAFPKNYKEQLDTDGDGIGNNADLDDDNDGVADTQDALPLDPKESIDTDKDGAGNNADLDDDNDGVTDTEEAKFGTNPLIADTDDDGVIDSKDAFPLDAKEQLDTDGDGIGNNADLDDDNDGVTDTEDKFPTNLTPVPAISSPWKLTQVGKEVIFDGSSTMDKDGQITNLTWKVNGVKLEGQTPKYTFKDAGKYKITLSATDNAGEISTMEKIIYVADYKTYLKILIVIILIALALTFGFKYNASLKKPKITNAPSPKATRTHINKTSRSDSTKKSKK